LSTWRNFNTTTNALIADMNGLTSASKSTRKVSKTKPRALRERDGPVREETGTILVAIMFSGCWSGISHLSEHQPFAA